MEATKSTKRGISSLSANPMMRVTIIEEAALSSKGVEFSLIMDVTLCQRIIRELRGAVFRLNQLLDEVSNCRLEDSLHYFMCEYRWKLNKYSIMKSDCSWQEQDEDLRKTIGLLENCYDTITAKNKFTLGELLYVIKVLETVIFNFESKISQLEEFL